MRALRIGSSALALVAVACVRSATHEGAAPAGAARAGAVPSMAEAFGAPVVRPARLVPGRIDARRTYGVERRGVRALTAGLRLIVGADGSMLTSTERFSSTPREVIALPERLGGGFLFVLPAPTGRGEVLFRADDWLEPARDIRTSPTNVERVMIGLDRVYVRSSGALVAIDAATGTELDRGPLPPSPFVADVATADAWRAVAVEDLRGVVATFDAGATWRSIDVPGRVTRAVATRTGIVVGDSPSSTWFALRDDGSVAPLAKPPSEALEHDDRRRAPASEARAPNAQDGETKVEAGTKAFGRTPLAAAVEDGWPIEGGVAVVARDGALGKIRLADGAVVALDPRAFAMPSARCHPVSLARATDERAFGFLCGAPGGPTVVYAYDAKANALAELKRFAGPRVVTASGSGTLAVRGGCDEETAHAHCVLGRDDRWREIRVHASAGQERVVALANGDIAVLSPTTSDKEPARLTLVTNGRTVTRPVVFEGGSKDVAFALKHGVWLDGIEERRPGVLGAWIEAGGSMLGVEIDREGHAKAGEFVRDTGLTFVSGRFGLGWSKARESYETTDGGMTWQRVRLPDPLVPASQVEERACGPVGCIAAGWIRVGWGEPPAVERAASAAAPVTKTPTLAPVALACEPIEAPPPPLESPAPARVRPRVTITLSPLSQGSARSSSASIFQGDDVGSTKLPPFFSHPAPALADSERGQDFKAGPYARVYAWGPETGGWETQGKWQVQWLPSFAGWSTVVRTAPALPPASAVDLLKLGPRYGWGWDMLAVDDDGHALIGHRRERFSAQALFELERDRTPLPIRNADGTSFTGVQDAVRVGGRWFVRTQSTPTTTANAAPTNVVYRIEGGYARELARIPRVGPSTSSAIGTLVRHSDGRSLGLLVDDTTTRWVLPIDPETGRVRDVERFDPLPPSGLESCTAEMEGWIFEGTPSSRSATSAMTIALSGSTSHDRLSPITVRTRRSADHECLEGVLGRYTGRGALNVARGRPLPRTKDLAKNVTVAAVVGEGRYELRCSIEGRERSASTP